MSTVAFYTAKDSKIGKDVYWRMVQRFPDWRWEVHHDAGEPSSDTLVVVSFLSPVIIPRWLLDAVGGRAYNVHPGTRWRPGRDPAHWAMYHEDVLIGATLHQMTEQVDAGPIIACYEEKRLPTWSISDLIARCERDAALLLGSAIRGLLDGSRQPDPALQWQGTATIRADFHAMCRLTADLSAAEVERRYRAFDVPGYENLVPVLP